jgi:hypothetical protein
MNADPWLKQIDEITLAVTESYGKMDEKDLNWQPSVNEWSIAQNLDHLITLNESYFPVWSQMRDGSIRKPFHAYFGFITRYFGKMILKAAHPETRTHMKTLEVWEPAEGPFPPTIIDRFSSHQQKLKEEIEASEEPIAKGAIMASPAKPFVVYRIDTAIEILIQHERRHLVQMERVKAMLEA